MRFVAEAFYRGCVKGDAVFERARQFLRHYGDVLLPAENVAKGKAYEFHVLFRDVLHDLIL